MGRYIKKTGQTTPVNAVVENTWSGSQTNAPSVAMVQDALVGENMLINSDFRHGAYKTLTISGVNVSSQDNNLVILSGVLSEVGNLNIVKIFEFNNFTLDAYDY